MEIILHTELKRSKTLLSFLDIFHIDYSLYSDFSMHYIIIEIEDSDLEKKEILDNIIMECALIKDVSLKDVSLPENFEKQYKKIEKSNYISNIEFDIVPKTVKRILNNNFLYSKLTTSSKIFLDSLNSPYAIIPLYSNQFSLRNQFIGSDCNIYRCFLNRNMYMIAAGEALLLKNYIYQLVSQIDFPFYFFDGEKKWIAYYGSKEENKSDIKMVCFDEVSKFDFEIGIFAFYNYQYGFSQFNTHRPTSLEHRGIKYKASIFRKETIEELLKHKFIE